jgi:F-type H+-transporting ATPase subunit b
VVAACHSLNSAILRVIAQVVWMLLIFAALYWLVKNKGLPLVESVLEERRARIQGDLEAARTAKANAGCGHGRAS